MGIVLEQAPPESEGVDIIGEVPDGTEEIAYTLFDETNQQRKDRSEELRRIMPKDHELLVDLPNAESSAPHTLPYDEVEFKEDRKNRRTVASFRQVVINELGEHKVRDITVGLTVATLIGVVAGLSHRKK